MRAIPSIPQQATLVILPAAAAGAALTLVWFEATPRQLTVVGMFVLAHLAVTVFGWLRARRIFEQHELLSVLLTLAQEPKVLDLFRCIAVSFRSIGANSDPIYRDLALERLRQIDREISSVARGHIIFRGTETWRMVYERLLRSRGLHRYRSVALVKTANYWQDEPGRQSMQVNYRMRRDGLTIERIAIIADHLWTAGERFPLEPLSAWLDDQQQHGISLKLVRHSSLANETDLLADLGIYGNRAVGFQELDEQGNTRLFTLSFDFSEVLAAEQRWERLCVYARPYRQPRDRFAPET